MFFSPFNNVEQIDRLHAPANSTAWNPLCQGVKLAAQLLCPEAFPRHAADIKKSRSLP